MQFTEIKIQGLPTVYNTDFIDSIFSRNRIVKLPEKHSIVNKTKEYYTTVSDTTHSKQRLIQTILYDKYTLEYYCNENSGIFNIVYAESITIVKPDGEEINAEVLDFQSERMEQTTMYKVTITFIDISADTYTVNNYLKTALDTWVQPYTTNFFNCSYIDGIGSNPMFTTLLNPKYSISEPEIKSTKETGNELATNIVYFKQVTFHFFLSESDKNLLSEYVNKIQTYNTNQAYVVWYDMKNTNGGFILEQPKLEVIENENLIDLYECIVTFRYEKIIRNPYNETDLQ